MRLRMPCFYGYCFIIISIYKNRTLISSQMNTSSMIVMTYDIYYSDLDMRSVLLSGPFYVISFMFNINEGNKTKQKSLFIFE